MEMGDGADSGMEYLEREILREAGILPEGEGESASRENVKGEANCASPSPSSRSEILDHSRCLLRVHSKPGAAHLRQSSPPPLLVILLLILPHSSKIIVCH